MVPIKIRLFALMKEKIGKEELQFDFLEGATARDILSFLGGVFHELVPILERSLIVVNGQYAPLGTPLAPGDEVAILPPVSGG